MNPFSPLPVGTAKSLLHALGIAVQQAVMYGPAHNVARLAAREAAATLAETLGRDGGLEVAIVPQGGGALVNGDAVSSPDTAGQAFLSRLEAHGVQELRFSPGFERSDVEDFLRLLAARPASSAASGGFRAALERAMPGGAIRVAESQWRKVGDGDSAAGPGEGPAAAEPRRPALPRGGAIDLSELADAAGALYGARGAVVPAAAPVAAGQGEGATVDLTSAFAEAEPRFGASRSEKEAAAAEGRARREADGHALSELLRRTADLLDRAGRPPDEAIRREVLETIERARALVDAGSDGTAHRIGELSRRIEADRATVESIEAASRRRGMGPSLTRVELLERFAELSQEIVQPLTVSTGAIDLIRTGKGGDLTEEQRSLLHLAAESLDRMRQLSERFARIAGLPEGFSPDRDVVV